MMDRVITEKRRRRTTRSGTVLSAELIVDTSLRLIEQHGAAALSARRLGTALGADPTALYRYFHNTDDLLLAVADELIGRAIDGFEPSGDWLATLRALGLRIYRTHLAYPHVAVLAACRVTRRGNEIRAIELILSVLHDAGFPPPAAVRYYHSFVDLVLSHSAQDAAVHALDPQVRAADAQAWQHTYARLGADTHPNIARAARHLVAGMNASSFEPTLDLFLETLAGKAGCCVR